MMDFLGYTCTRSILFSIFIQAMLDIVDEDMRDQGKTALGSGCS